MSETILSVKNLQVSFQTFDGKVQAVRGIDFDLKKGETLAIVGESGSGKSVTTRSIMQLLSANALVENGEIIFEQENILEKSESEMQQIRGKKIAMIFQDPMTSLDPTMKVGLQVAESMIKHLKLSKKEALQQDEPTTALDVTIQAQILELLKEIQQKNGTSIIFITHDLGVVANVADRVAVMYAGKIVEYGLVDEIFYNPRHPYTWGLLCSMPSLEEEGALYTIPGTPPDLLNPPKGDAFALRSDYALDIDFEEMPPMFAVSNTHAAATWLLDERAPKVEPPEEIQKRWAQFESRRVTNE